jgi:hypothetical protein
MKGDNDKKIAITYQTCNSQILREYIAKNASQMKGILNFITNLKNFIEQLRNSFGEMLVVEYFSAIPGVDYEQTRSQLTLRPLQMQHA